MIRAYECRPVFMGDNRAAIRTLLDILAEGDLSVLPMLSDELSMAGDEREGRCKWLANFVATCEGKHRSEIAAQVFLSLFPELCDPSLTVQSWKFRTSGRRLKFKQRLIKIGLRYEYDGHGSGALRISYASPRQLEQVQHARRALLGEDRQDMPLFEEGGKGE